MPLSQWNVASLVEFQDVGDTPQTLILLWVSSWPLGWRWVSFIYVHSYDKTLGDFMTWMNRLIGYGHALPFRTTCDCINRGGHHKNVLAKTAIAPSETMQGNSMVGHMLPIITRHNSHGVSGERLKHCHMGGVGGEKSYIIGLDLWAWKGVSALANYCTALIQSCHSVSAYISSTASYSCYSDLWCYAIDPSV